MKLVLAPMAGLSDFYMRDVLTRMGRYDWCVSEFIRVSDQLLPAKIFRLMCPELEMSGKTAVGTPVHVQLLGSDVTLMAENAARAAELGAPAIDLNFGCPAKTVNKHGGGAVLLEEPNVVHNVVSAVRRAVPAHIPVSAKMRLGVRDWSKMIENAQGIEAAGASWLTVHARTKEDRYQPPAHWQAIAQIREHVTLTVIANGEIWSVDNARECRRVSGCDHLMLGRGAVQQPYLVEHIRGSHEILLWKNLVNAQINLMDKMTAINFHSDKKPSAMPLQAWSERTALGRSKQWLSMLAISYPEAATLFLNVKKENNFTVFRSQLSNTAGRL